MRHVYLERATRDLGEQMSQGGGQVSFPKPPPSMSLHSVLLASPFPLTAVSRAGNQQEPGLWPRTQGPRGLAWKADFLELWDVARLGRKMGCCEGMGPLRKAGRASGGG